MAQVGDLDQLFGAAVAGELDHVDQRGIVILIGDGSVLQTGDDAVVLVHAAGGQTHGQTDALLDDGALQEDVLAELTLFTGDDGVRDLAHQVVGGLALHVGIGHPRHLGEHLAADLDDRRIDSSKTHSNLSLYRNHKTSRRTAAFSWVRQRIFYGHCWYRTAAISALARRFHVHFNTKTLP